MKARVLNFLEIEERFRAILTKLEGRPRDEVLIIDMGSQLLFALGVCISQMKAPNSNSYPEKSRHLEILEKASSDITYKINTCTVEEIATQVNSAYRAFGAH
jgi:hypothetical protein